MLLYVAIGDSIVWKGLNIDIYYSSYLGLLGYKTGNDFFTMHDFFTKEVINQQIKYSVVE